MKDSISIILFFTDGFSLKKWHQRGNYEREIALYKRLLERGVKCGFFTYGKGDERDYIKNLGDIKVIYNKYNLPKILYKISAPFLYFNFFYQADIFKTHQIKGSTYPVFLKKIFRKKLIVRGGFLPSIFAQKRNWLLKKIRAIENKAFTNANQIIVPASFERDYIISHYSISGNKINLIPNYVDPNIFKPNPEIKKIKNRICTIAKKAVHNQKNLYVLIEALKFLPEIKLVITGRCNEDKKLREKVKEYQKKYRLNIEFLGIIPNNKIPQELNKSVIFIQPSLYEGGSCKAILEAMACGLPVIGSNVEGINSVIKHKENGYLCKTSPESIEEAIKEVIIDEKLQKYIGENARKWVLNYYSLDKILEKELHLYQKILNKK